MARRKSRKSPSRSRSKTFSALGLAESALIANAVTTGFLNCPLNDFIFSTNGVSGSNGRTAITARELLAGIMGGGSGSTGYGTSSAYVTAKVGGGTQTIRGGQAFGLQVRENLEENGGKMLGSLILIPVGFKVFSKLTSKPRSQLNRVMKMSGLPLKV